MSGFLKFPARLSAISRQPRTAQNVRKYPEMSGFLKFPARLSAISRPISEQKIPVQTTPKRGETMTLARIRREVNALCRKYAPQLAARRAKLEIESATPIAEDFCDEMEAALTADEPGPIMNGAGWSWCLFEDLHRRGIRPMSKVALNRYVDVCLMSLIPPQVNEILRCLFPRAVNRSLIPAAG